MSLEVIFNYKDQGPQVNMFQMKAYVIGHVVLFRFDPALEGCKGMP